MPLCARAHGQTHVFGHVHSIHVCKYIPYAKRSVLRVRLKRTCTMYVRSFLVTWRVTCTSSTISSQFLIFLLDRKTNRRTWRSTAYRAPQLQQSVRACALCGRINRTYYDVVRYIIKIRILPGTTCSLRTVAQATVVEFILRHVRVREPARKRKKNTLRTLR